MSSRADGNGRISDADLEEVRRRAGIVDVLSEYMSLKQAGRTWKGLCPFHAEKTPSFTVDQSKQVWYCFGCSKGGDVISFVQELEQLNFVETVERLARKTGVTLHYEQLSPADREKSKQKSRLIEAHREAVAFYREQLQKAPEAKTARDYLEQRRLKPETLDRFGVGYSPDKWDALTKHLKAKGLKEDELVAAGLATRTERGGLIDRFRGRVMFPIYDLTGDPRAFGARILKDDGGPKYLNSAETPIYKKGTILYALNWAKADVTKADVAIVVEGYTDVMALHQEGIPLAVASCGTALNVEHFQTLSRFTRHVMIALDADQAGRQAAERAVEQAFLGAQERDMDLRVLTLPTGQDPADFATAQGGDAFRKEMAASKPVVQFRLESRVAGLDLTEPEGRSRALRNCLPVLAQVKDEVMRRDYSKWVADRASLDYDVVFLEISKALGGSTPAAAPASIRKTSAQVRLEREAIKVALQFPDEADEYLDLVEPGDFSVKVNRELWTLLRQGTNDPAHLAEAAGDVATRLSIEPIEGHESLSEPPPDRLLAEIFTRLQEFALTRQITEVKARLEKLNPIADPDAYDALFKEMIGLEGARRRHRDDEPGHA
jgi:DNA primase